MYAEDGEFKDEIAYFSSIDNHMHYNSEYYICIAKVLGEINKGIEPIAEKLVEFSPDLGNISISSEVVVRTLKVFGELYTNIAIDADKYMEQKKYKLVYNRSFNVLSENLSIKMESVDNSFADAA